MKKLLLILLLIPCLLSACNPFDNSSKPSESIDCASSIGVGRISLNLSVERYTPAGDYCYFNVSKTLFQIKEELKQKNNIYSFQIINDVLLVEQNVSGKIISYGIFQIPNGFTFLPLEIHLKDPEKSYKTHTFIAPIHYNKNLKEVTLGILRLYETYLYQEWIPINCDEKEYIKFYEDSNLFFIQREEEQYKLKAKEVNKKDAGFQHYELWFYIEYKLENNQSFVKYSIETE